MGRGLAKYASISSVNLVDFDFPYAGAQRARLLLRIHPKYGKDVILSIERGQFLCGIDGCNITVRFDDGKPANYSVTEPADHKTTMLFIDEYSRFVSRLKRAKKLQIEARFYQQGNHVFEFDVSGLKWEEKPVKQAKKAD